MTATATAVETTESPETATVSPPLPPELEYLLKFATPRQPDDKERYLNRVNAVDVAGQRWLAACDTHKLIAVPAPPVWQDVPVDTMAQQLVDRLVVGRTTAPVAHPIAYPEFRAWCMPGDGIVRRTCTLCRGYGKFRCEECNGRGKNECQVCGYECCACKECGGSGRLKCWQCIRGMEYAHEAHYGFINITKFNLNFIAEPLLHLPTCEWLQLILPAPGNDVLQIIAPDWIVVVSSISEDPRWHPGRAEWESGLPRLYLDWAINMWS